MRSDGNTGSSFEADPVFVAKWKLKYPSYKSPVVTSASTNSTSKRFM
jgi:hypothetical protein